MFNMLSRGRDRETAREWSRCAASVAYRQSNAAVGCLARIASAFHVTTSLDNQVAAGGTEGRRFDSFRPSLLGAPTPFRATLPRTFSAD